MSQKYGAIIWILFLSLLEIRKLEVYAQAQSASIAEWAGPKIVDKTKFEEEQKDINSEKQKYIFVKGIAQGPSQCVSTCTSMLLAEMSIEMTADQIEQFTSGKTGAKPALSSIVKMLDKKNIKLTMARYERKNGKTDIILKYIKELLKKNTPSAILRNHHMQVCVGYDEQKEVLYVIDPAKADKICIIPMDVFCQELEKSIELNKWEKIFLLHKNTFLDQFILLPKQGKETSQSFVLNVQRSDDKP